ncbi:T9SS type A sorting domain-containing protein [uncultured Psychroserpens sp.]|uniref:T9SS type A sorting domain-containing protein n=1 Tax=uncultured Psychroserpens sp. TaxID=255436 RepID=UPI00262CD0DE|nr:T9SS type A sorting domain-containing protein [uncultured Psychroserpens sp.]
MKSNILLSLVTLMSCCLNSQVQVGDDINGNSINNALGWSVATSGDGQTVVVGSPNATINGDSSGKIQVYQFNGTNWIQLGNDLDSYNESDNAGRSVDITDDGTTLVIGIQYSDLFDINAGSVQVYEFDGTDWIQKGVTLNGSDDSHEFGTNVAISNDGNRIAVGAPYFDSNTNGFDTGALKVFDYDGTQWNLSFEVEGDTENDVFGVSLDMSSDGNHIICGASINEDGTSRVGYAKVFSLVNSAWIQTGSTITGEGPAIFFGASSAISDNGNRVAIGSWGNNENGNFSGEVEVFELNANSWEPLGLDLQGESSFERFGWSIDLSGDGETLVIGAYQANYTKIYKLVNDNWNQIGNTLFGINGNDEFGYSVDVTTDGNKIVIGDPSNDNLASFAGFAQVYDITELLSIEELDNRLFSVYPNPASSELVIKSVSMLNRITIVDFNGRVLKQISVTDSRSVTINVSEFLSGIYFLDIEGKDQRQSVKFLKN